MTDNLPSGCIVVAFTALGMILEGRRLLIFSLRWLRIALPAAEMSAPESERT